MGGLNPNIILAAGQPQQPANLLDLRAKALSIQQAQQQNQAGALQLQQAQQTQQEQDQLRQLFASKPMATDDEVMQVAPITGPKLLEGRANLRKTIAETEKATAEAQEKQSGMAAGLIYQLTQPGTSDHDVQMTIGTLTSDPKNRVASQIGSQLSQVYQQGGLQGVQQYGVKYAQSNPQIMSKIAEMKTAQARQKEAEIAGQRQQDEHDKTQAEMPGIQADSLQKQIATADSQLRTSKTAQAYSDNYNRLPDAVKPYFDAPDGSIKPIMNLVQDKMRGLTSQQRIEAQQKDQQQAEQNRHNVADEKVQAQNARTAAARLKLEQEQSGVALNLTPQALDNAANLYNKTGQLPPMGMGKQGGAVRSVILNRAAELSGATDIAANKAGYKADSESLAGLQKMRDSVGAFEDTSGKNLDLFLNQAKGVVDAGSPLVNTPLRMVSGKVAGSANQAAYEAARQVAVNEIAKVTSNPNLSGTLSDSARREIAAFSPENATLKQVYAVANILKQDMANRRISLDNQISQVKGRISSGGSGSSSSGGSAPAVTKATHRYNPATGKIEAIR